MSQTVETTKRNGEIDFFRFIFCMMIIIMHYGYYCTAGKRVFFIGAPIGVEFFFLVCGWLMAAHIHKLSGNEKPGKATAEYLTNRLKSILPYTTIGVVLAFITASADTGTGAFTLFKRGLVAVLEILLLPELGVGFDTYVPVLWYVSSMLFAILILYPIFVWNKDIYLNVLAPIFMIVYLGWIFQTDGLLNGHGSWHTIATNGTFRAIGEISAGCICFNLSKKISQSVNGKFSRIALSAANIIGYITVIVMAFFNSGNVLEFVQLFILIFCVSATFSNKCIETKLFENKLFYFLGKLALPMYTFQCAVLRSYWYLNLQMSYYPKFILGVVLMVGCSLIVMIGLQWAKERHRQLSIRN